MSGRAWRVGILGAGRMAQGFDQPGDPHVLTLAHAVTESPAFTLGGFYDVDQRRAEAAERTWGCPPSPRERTVWLREPWDLVCIATPSERHADDLRDVLARAPKAVLVEKPLATSGDDALRLLEEAARRGIPILVDFPRRWHSGVAAVGAHIQAGELGPPVVADLAFSGGMLRNGIHMLDLFHTWWGGGWQATLRHRQGPRACLTFERHGETVEVACLDLAAEAYYAWEMRVFCQRGKVELSQSPEYLELSLPASHPVYQSVEVLRPVARFAMEEERLLVRLMEEVAGAIADPARARMLLQREIASHTFSGQVLRSLEAPGLSLVREGASWRH